MDTFPADPVASQGSGRDTKANVSLVQFGDGYSQRIPTGINNIVGTLNLVWKSLTSDELSTLVSFLEDHNGNESFLYTLPGEVSTKTYFCRTWKETSGQAGLTDFTATFEQTFES